MNITYYKKHLKEMKRLLSKTKSKKESIKRMSEKDKTTSKEGGDSCNIRKIQRPLEIC